ESNIFVSKNNVFKLGDFGVSRDVTDFSRVSTKVGTISYMAPEVFNGKKYDIRADIYSLGLLLYKLLNHNRLPFLPVYPENFSFENLQNSQIKRYSGETFPKINNCPQDLFNSILKACSFSPLDRFETPREFNKLLIQILTKLNDKNKESINIESTNIESIYNQETLEIKSEYNNSNRKNINDEVNQTNNINTNIDNDILNFETIYVGNDSEKNNKNNKNNTDLTDISIFDYLSENEKNIFNSLDGCKQNVIGNNYFYGIDEQNYKKAFIWYEKAAQNGVLEAYKNLGYIYYRGYGVNKDYEKAKNYFIKAAIKGEEFSISKLKIMHRDGQIDNLEYNKIKRLLL
ncbi:MAG: protein kinase, partial [Clostridiales bacterium]